MAQGFGPVYVKACGRDESNKQAPAIATGFTKAHDRGRPIWQDDWFELPEGRRFHARRAFFVNRPGDARERTTRISGEAATSSGSSSGGSRNKPCWDTPANFHLSNIFSRGDIVAKADSAPATFRGICGSDAALEGESAMEKFQMSGKRRMRAIQDLFDSRPRYAGFGSPQDTQGHGEE